MNAGPGQADAGGRDDDAELELWARDLAEEVGRAINESLRAPREHQHRWQERKEVVDGTQLSGVEVCADCGTGFELRFTAGDGSARTTTTVLPSHGETAGQIHPEVLARAVQRRDQASAELRGMGFDVVHRPIWLGRPDTDDAPPTPAGRARTPFVVAGAAVAVLLVLAAAALWYRPATGAGDHPATGGTTVADRRGSTTPPPVVETTSAATVGPPAPSPPGGSDPGAGSGNGGSGGSTGGGNTGNDAPAGTPPGLPATVYAAAMNPHTIRVTWADMSSDETGFDVYNGSELRTVPPNTNQYDWGGLDPGTYMCFRVRAHNAFGPSAYSPANPPYYACATTPPDTLPAPPSFVYPVNGQNLGLTGSYLFKVTAVPGASGYLFGFVQDGVSVWENQANEGTLSGTEYGIGVGTAGHDRFHLGDVQVSVRALVGGGWTDPRTITIHLI